MICQQIRLKIVKIMITLMIISLKLGNLILNPYLLNYLLLIISIICFNSSLVRSVEINTSCAVLPFLAMALYPFMVLQIIKLSI